MNTFLRTLCALMLAYGASSANAGTFSLLHVFLGSSDTNFYGPDGALVQDATGNLYGTTLYGSNGNGDVYELTPPTPGETKWAYKEIYSFTGATDGSIPGDALVFDHNGNLYGTTSAGGNATCTTAIGSGCGTVFELTQSGGTWTEHTLHAFVDNPKSTIPNAGTVPYSGLTIDADGNLYGTTLGGYGPYSGTVFELSSPTTGKVWKLKILHQFCDVAQNTCTDGSGPMANLVFDNVGNIYGTTVTGGAAGNREGTVFELSPPLPGKTPWREQILYSGGGSIGSDNPRNFQTGLIFINGALYGTSTGGGTHNHGTVFSLVPSGKTSVMTVLHKFDGTHGDDPQTPSGLILDSGGNLYGTASLGGADGWGTVFKLTYGTGVFQTLHTFKSGTHDGAIPFDGLIFDKNSGNLLGTTEFGGAPSETGGGTVFELVP